MFMFMYMFYFLLKCSDTQCNSSSLPLSRHASSYQEYDYLTSMSSLLVLVCVCVCVTGLTAVVCVKVPEPEFEGQTKTRLGNPEVRTFVTVLLITLFSVRLHSFLFNLFPFLISHISSCHPQYSFAIFMFIYFYQVRQIVDSVVSDSLITLFEWNPQVRRCSEEVVF